MAEHTARGAEIAAFLLEQVPHHPKDLVRVTCEKFGITRQAVNRYLDEMETEGAIFATGNTNQRQYKLKVIREERLELNLQGLEEDVVWRTNIAPLLAELPSNVLGVWQYSVCEMVNNAIDHSGGSLLAITIEKTKINTEIMIRDNGVGIFRKIKDEFHLEDEKHAVLELAKGKLTTDPAKHTGEGIFFTSRMLDDFTILSGNVFFTHMQEGDVDWISDRDKPDSGTTIFMTHSNSSQRTPKDIFDQYTSGEHEYGFTKTVVPVRLVRHGMEQLISRSQAKRLLARLDRFSKVIFDFSSVQTIGQAFADEIFRVFERSHPDISLIAMNADPSVEQMIRRARSAPHESNILPSDNALDRANPSTHDSPSDQK